MAGLVLLSFVALPVGIVGAIIYLAIAVARGNVLTKRTFFLLIGALVVPYLALYAAFALEGQAPDDIAAANMLNVPLLVEAAYVGLGALIGRTPSSPANTRSLRV